MKISLKKPLIKKISKNLNLFGCQINLNLAIKIGGNFKSNLS